MTKINKLTIQKKFEDILKFKDDKEKLEFDIERFQLNFVHEILILMEEQNIEKEKLAKLLGITEKKLSEYFAVDRLFDLKIMFKLQEIFDIKFKIVKNE